MGLLEMLKGPTKVVIGNGPEASSSQARSYTRPDGRRADQLRPRRAERRHPARRGGAGGCGAGARRRLEASALLRDGGGAPGAVRVGRRASRPRRPVPGDDHQRLARGRRDAVPAPARRPGTGWSSSSRPTTARCCCWSGSAPSASAWPLEEDGIDVEALERLLVEGAAREARPRDPQLPQPGRLHPLGRQARAPGRARRRARFLDLRGRPLPRAAVRRSSRRRRCCRSTAPGG